MPDFNINIKKMNPRAVIPAQGTQGAAGYDLCACVEAPVTIYPGETVMIPTGLAMEIPLGIAGLIFARSGLATQRGLAPANKVAVIDPDYRGEIFVSLLNHGKVQQTIQPGDRIAQMVFTPYFAPAFTETEALSDTRRGAGGFGSTGTAAPASAPAPAPTSALAPAPAPAPKAAPAPVPAPAPAPVPAEPEMPAESDPDDDRSDDERKADAAFELGMRYKQGDGVEQSNEKALEQFKIAAELGHVHAQLVVAGYYYSKNDCAEAAKWLEMAVALGNAEAMFQLGVFYTEGMGVDQDLEKAADLFYRAARRHHAEARFAYADCCSQGNGVPQDLEKAFKWFSAAAEQGHVESMFRLAQCYEKGEGTKKDLTEAKKWYNEAARKGHRGAPQAMVMLQLAEMEEQTDLSPSVK